MYKRIPIDEIPVEVEQKYLRPFNTEYWKKNKHGVYYAFLHQDDMTASIQDLIENIWQLEEHSCWGLDKDYEVVKLWPDPKRLPEYEVRYELQRLIKVGLVIKLD